MDGIDVNEEWKEPEEWKELEDFEKVEADISEVFDEIYKDQHSSRMARLRKWFAGKIEQDMPMVMDRLIESRSKKHDAPLLELTGGNKEFDSFESRLADKYGVAYDKSTHPGYFSYVSSLFLLDFMEGSFGRTGIELPDEMSVIDVGSGDFSYAIELLRFLQRYGMEPGDERDVRLTGVDCNGGMYKRRLMERVEGVPIDYKVGDIMDTPEGQKFDMLFMAHMIVYEHHCKTWHVPYVGPRKLFGRINRLLKDDGHMVVATYTHAGESSIMNYIPEGATLDEVMYRQPVNSLRNFLYPKYSFDNNMFCVAKRF